MSVFRVVETITVAKSGSLSDCEDLIVDGEDFLVLCDGATDKSGLRFNGQTGGQVVAEIVCAVVAGAPTGTSGAELVELINAVCETRLGDQLVGVATVDRPAASFCAVDKNARLVIRVGDCSWRTADHAHPGSKEVDDIAADARAALLSALTLSGVSAAELAATDPGRQMILPLLRSQAIFANVDAGLGFGVVNGLPIPARFIEEWQLDAEDRDLAISSDGYPELFMESARCERYLRDDLTTDPMRVGVHRSTKGRTPGNVSFDDRAYVRLTDRPQHR